MELENALQLLKEHHFVAEKPTLNESDLRFDSMDQFIDFTKAKGYYQNQVKIGTINTVLSEKDLKTAGDDIGGLIIKHYCKDYETSKKELQEAWNLGWTIEDPDGYVEDDFKDAKNIDECVEVFRKAAIMHAFLNNF
jgi:hypothetical protein